MIGKHIGTRSRCAWLQASPSLEESSPTPVEGSRRISRNPTTPCISEPVVELTQRGKERLSMAPQGLQERLRGGDDLH